MIKLKDVDGGLVRLFESNSKIYKTSNAYLGVIVFDTFGKQQLRTVGSWACHGGFQRGTLKAYLHVGDKLFVLLSSVQACRETILDEGKKTYIGWLVSESPYKDIFIEKNPDSILTTGWVIDPNHPQNLVAGGCIATRFFTENYVTGLRERFEVWIEAVKAGFTGNEAYIMALLFYPTKGKTYPIQYSNYGSNGHCSVELSTLNDAKNFITNSPIFLDGSSFKSLVGYTSGVSNTWRGGGRGKNSLDSIRVLKPLTGEVGVNLNIFYKEPLSKTFSIKNREELVDVFTQARELIKNAS